MDTPTLVSITAANSSVSNSGFTPDVAISFALIFFVAFPVALYGFCKLINYIETKRGTK